MQIFNQALSFIVVASVLSIGTAFLEVQSVASEAPKPKRHQDFAPDISPNGNFITYYSYRGDPTPDLFVFDISRGHEIRVTHTPDIWEIEPRWIDDKHIVFAAGESMQGLEVEILNFETGARDAFHPSLRDENNLEFGPSNPLGNNQLVSIARSGNGQDHMIVIDRDGSFVKITTQLPRGENASPHASPDGRHIVFRNSFEGRTDLYILDRQSGEHWQITDSAAEENYINWSRDGRWILYRPEDESSLPYIFGIQIDLAAKTMTPPRQLANGNDSQVHFYSSVSADGQWLYYDGNVERNFYIFRQSLAKPEMPAQQVTGATRH